MERGGVKATLFAAVVSVFLGATLGEDSPFAAEGIRVRELTLAEESGHRYRLVLKTDGPLPASSCRVLEEGGVARLVLELPMTDSALQPVYEFPGVLLGAIKVLAPAGAKGTGLRVEVPLKGIALCGWEQNSQGLVICLVGAQEVGRASEADPYKLGIGDRLELAVFGHDDLHDVVEILADGTVGFPVVGVLPAAGRTLAEVRADLVKRMGEYLVDPQVSLDIKEYQSQPINVVGEVEKPGKYFLKGPTLLVDILAQAGWMTREAGSDILITRHDGLGKDSRVRQILVKKEDLLGAGNENNAQVQAGDVVTVGPKQYFYIRGEIIKPGQYPLEDRPTLLKAVSIAGGLNPYAKQKGIELVRTVKGVQTKRVVDLRGIEEGKTADIPLLPDDVIIVPRRLF